MPPKNAFYMFMLSEQKKLRVAGSHTPTMQDMPGLCINRWKCMSKEEKSIYEAMAQRENAKAKNGRGCKMDNRGRLISERKDPVEEDKKRRMQETTAMMSSWSGQDLNQIKFHLIDFQVMFDERYGDDTHLPMEVGVVCITMKDGILKSMHRIIDPGDAPQGSRRIAMEYAESHHQIPLNFEQGDKNFTSLWLELERFLADGPQDDLAPLYCLSINREIVESCLEFCFYRAATGGPNRIYKLYCIEDLVMSLMLRSGKVDDRPSGSQIYDTLIQNRWDYTSNIRCSYHEEVDSCWCSISIVKRYSFVIFDLLSKLLDFPLTSRHMPDERNYNFRLITGFITANNSSSRHCSDTPPRFSRPTPFSSKPTDRYVIQQEESDKESDEEEDAPVVGRDGKETPLRKLRLPRTLPMAAQVADLKPATDNFTGPLNTFTGLQSTCTGPRPAGRGILTLSCAPWGEAVVAPPPGFGPKPASSTIYTPVVPGVNLQPQSTFVQSQGRGLPLTGGSRGRGLPPQMSRTPALGRGRGV